MITVEPHDRQLVRTEPTARQTIAEIVAGHMSPLDVVDAAVARIEEVEPKINALPVTCFDRARSAARRMADKVARGEDWPPLCGLPLAVKDNTDLAGVPTSGGSRLTAGRVPESSDPVIAQLETNGAIAIAKSNLCELGGAHTSNRLFGTTVNPYDLSRSVGGSSGGSAAALACGEVYFGHGNDVGGSLRTPAAFCGVAGLRPTPGLVPRKRLSLPFDPVFVEGPMARNVADLALMLDAMSARVSHDPLSQAPEGSLLDAAQRPVMPERIAVSETLGLLPVSAEVRADFSAAMAKLARAGLDAEPGHPAFDDMPEAIRILRGLAYAITWRDFWPEKADAFTPDVRDDIARGQELRGPEIAWAETVRATAFRASIAFFETFDLLICPSVQVRPFPADQFWPREIDGVSCPTYIDWIAITYIWSMLGHPALAVPVGFGETGLPVSIQIVGPPRSEARILAFGSWVERALGA